MLMRTLGSRDFRNVRLNSEALERARRMGPMWHSKLNAVIEQYAFRLESKLLAYLDEAQRATYFAGTFRFETKNLIQTIIQRADPQPSPKRQRGRKHHTIAVNVDTHDRLSRIATACNSKLSHILNGIGVTYEAAILPAMNEIERGKYFAGTLTLPERQAIFERAQKSRAQFAPDKTTVL